MVQERAPEIDARSINTIPLGPDSEGREVSVRVGRYGPYLSRGEATSPVPTDLAPDELTIDLATQLLDKGPEEGRVLGVDPATGLEVSVRGGRFGPYVQLGEQEAGSKVKPKRGSLFKSMEPANVTLEEALLLLSLPRVVGKAEDGTEIVASPGRFGPYLKKGDDTRSLPSEDSLLTVTLEEANEIFAQPKRGRGRSAPEALAELGAHPTSGAPIKLLAGRYGPYVTDGTTNASIPKGVDPAAFTLDEAVALLKAREEAGPAKKPKRAPARKATAKKAAAKKKKG
jgi:DNA topoisomerase-1